MPSFPILQTTVIELTVNKPPLKPGKHRLHLFHLQVSSLTMAPKSKSSETVENPFLPPPVDLDRIPLADKDYLIAEPKCEFDFFELHFWLKDVFLDQSDEIGTLGIQSSTVSFSPDIPFSLNFP
jgi:hypothetical protein